MPKYLTRILPLAGLLALAATAPAPAAVTIGSNLKHVPNNSACAPTAQSPSCTMLSTVLPSESTATGGVVSPIDGVVVRWHVRSTSSTGEFLRPRVLSSDTGGAAGDFIYPPNVAAILTYQTRLSITKGQYFGVDVVGGNGAPIVFTNAGAGNTTVFFPLLPPGATVATVKSAASNLETLVSADIEADLDGDGYGDQTQDQCPTDKSTQGPCPKAPPAGTGTTTPPPTTTTPTGTPSGTTPSEPLSVALSSLDGSAIFPGRSSLARALRKGLTGQVGASQKATVVAVATAAGGAARVRTVARGHTVVTGSGQSKLTLRFTKAARKRLRKAHRTKLTLRLTLTDVSGRTVTLTRRVTLVGKR